MPSILLALLFFASLTPAAAQEVGKGLVSIPDTPMASDFLLTDLDGNRHRLSEYRGQLVIVNFWATWCPPCRAEMPSMQRAWEQLEKEGIMMFGINVGEDEETIFQFTANYPVELSISGRCVACPLPL